MFDDLQKRLGTAFRRFRVSGLLTEANMKEGLREVRTALLEADVNFKVVQKFMDRVTAKAVGTQLIKAVRPEQQIVKIVHDELIELMGEADPTVRFEKAGPTVLMLCGLQGSGKTTTCGKLARMLANQGRRPMLVAADLQRPAAVEQLKVIGGQLNLPVFSEANSNPVKVCQDALVEANRQNCDTIILDTAGRLHVDDELMAELVQIEKKVKPHQVFFVCDAMTGQDAVASAEAFNKALELDGVILTKLDGDARGGAALSVRKVTGVPIKFVGKGEKLDQLDPFAPERLAGQILGMGDIVSVVERAQQAVDAEEARRQQERLAKGKFDLNDFRQQIVQMKKMGSVRELMSMIPGLNQLSGEMGGIDAEGEIKRIQGIIDSMTPLERSRPDLIDMARRRRIASGAGVDPSDVSGLVKQFDAMAAIVRSMSQMSMFDKLKALTGLGKAAASNPGARIFAPKVGTGKRLSPKEREKLRKQREKEERKRRREERDRPT
ncbi:Signal recognition particle protein [Aquisphaera giovannonii]|uniref:Signal recognition particle protein n=1 Tax=Aquisphaera giovannonii TaxID=406548 RepID=A0A5B9W9D5_9BACT|nr:signal recognition particle protein [Aquisphaera giovannonii]QEH36681.1 Signal recognition particle protein [Aquisphaera giovannonii]